MSYARFGEADVYVYMSASGDGLVCQDCALGDISYQAYSTAAMVGHLRLHQFKGHRVPDHVVPALWNDDAYNFPKAQP